MSVRSGRIDIWRGIERDREGWTFWEGTEEGLPSWDKRRFRDRHGEDGG